MKIESTGKPIVYIHSISLPAPQANSVQVVAMCEALGGTRPTYLAANRGSDSERLFEIYGAEPTFEMFWLKKPRIALGVGIRSVAQVVRGFSRAWTCFTRVPMVALASCLMRIPTFLEIHALPIFPSHQRIYRFLQRSRSLKGIVLISKALERDLLAAGYFARTPVLVAHDAGKFSTARSDKAAARREFHLPLDAKIVGYAGSLKPDKGVQVLLDALAGVESPVAVIAGGYPKERFEELQASDAANAIWLGAIEPARIPTFLSACDVLVAPYVEGSNVTWTRRSGDLHQVISDHMSPLKLFEAFASGRPLVISEFEVLLEVVSPGVDCLAVPAGDPQALRDSIERLLNDPDLSERLSAAAKATLRDHTWKARASRVLEFIAACES